MHLEVFSERVKLPVSSRKVCILTRIACTIIMHKDFHVGDTMDLAVLNSNIIQLTISKETSTKRYPSFYKSQATEKQMRNLLCTCI